MTERPRQRPELRKPGPKDIIPLAEDLLHLIDREKGLRQDFKDHATAHTAAIIMLLRGLD